MPPLDDLIAHFRLADALDIVVVAVLLFAALSWLRQRVSHALLICFALVGALYFAAHALQMYLTLLFFQVGVAIISFAFIVIFQQDLRRGFERIASWRFHWPGHADEPQQSQFLDAFVESVGILAQLRIGALFVFRGRESLDAHIRGGVPLNGEISIPLIHSLFDSKTPGHDGALLIDRDRLVRFGAHLPLSQNLAEVRGHGTRHAAALGLAERCDALVVVVSEERGTISIAMEGKFVEVDSAAALRGPVARFRKAGSSRQPTPLRRWALVQLPVISLSVFFSFLLWFTLASRVDRIEMPIENVTIEYRNLPRGWELDDNAPAKMRLTLSGPERALRAFNRESLKVAVDLKDHVEGKNSFTVTGNLLDLPDGIDLRASEKDTFEFWLYRRLEIPVEANLERSTLPKGYTIERVKVVPARQALLIHRPGFPDPTSLATEPIPLGSITMTTELKVPLELPPAYSHFPEGEPPTVQVTITVDKTK